MFNKKFLLISLLFVGYVHADDRCSACGNSACCDGATCTEQCDDPAVEGQKQQVNQLDEFRKTLTEDQQKSFDGLVSALNGEEKKFNDCITTAQKDFEEGVVKVAEQYRDLLDQLKKFLGQEDMQVQLRRLVEVSSKL